MCGSIVDIQSATAKNRRGKKKEETTAAKYNGLPYWAATISVFVTTAATSAVSSFHSQERSVLWRKQSSDQAYSEHKHSLTFRVRRYVVIATKPVHQLQIRQIVHNHSPSYIQIRAVV